MFDRFRQVLVLDFFENFLKFSEIFKKNSEDSEHREEEISLFSMSPRVLYLLLWLLSKIFCHHIYLLKNDTYKVLLFAFYI